MNGGKAPGHTEVASIVCTSVFQPGFRGTSGFRGCLPGVPLKQTEITLDEFHKHSSMRL